MTLRAALVFLVLPVLLFACALLMIWVPLPLPFPPAMSGRRNLMAAVVTGLLGLGYVVGIGAYATAQFLRAGRVLDPVLVTAGLDAQGYALVGRRYRGEIGGRGVEVTFMPAQVIRPAQLNVTVRVDLGTRIALGRKRPLLDCRDCARLAVTGREGTALHVYAEDEVRAQHLMDDATTREIVSRLLDDRVGLSEIYLQPARVWVRSRPYALMASQFEPWFADIQALVAVSETILVTR